MIMMIDNDDDKNVDCKKDDPHVVADLHPSIHLLSFHHLKSRLRRQLPAALDQDLAGASAGFDHPPVSAVKFSPIPARSCSCFQSMSPSSCH